MPSLWVIVYGSLLLIQLFSSHALPISENAFISSGPPRKAINESTPEPASSSLTHPQSMGKGRPPPIELEDSDNPSLLTSIPTFAPPAAIKGRGDNRDDVGIIVPIPTISFGIPSVRAIRKRISERLRKMLRRSQSPKVHNLYHQIRQMLYNHTRHLYQTVRWIS